MTWITTEELTISDTPLTSVALNVVWGPSDGPRREGEMATVAKPAIRMEGAEPVTEAVLKFRLSYFYWIWCPYFCGLTVTVLRVQVRLRGRATGTPEPSRAVGCEWWRVRSHPNSRIVALARDLLRERTRAPKLLQRVARLSVDRCRIARLRRHWHPPLHLRADKTASMIAASSNRRRRPSTARGDYI